MLRTENRLGIAGLSISIMEQAARICLICAASPRSWLLQSAKRAGATDSAWPVRGR